jgi:methylthioribose-1-phosphate isomerase
MRSRWNDAEAASFVAASEAAPPELMLRVYTSRLLGAERSLVLHGGGNTSVKTQLEDLHGTLEEVLFVKGSGSDLASIDAADFCAVRLEPVRRLAHLTDLDNAALAASVSTALARPSAHKPSIETLLHALLPWKFVEHSRQPSSSIAHALLREAQAMHVEDIAANRRMGALGAALVPDGARILTHCNAGALATAGHGTALGVIRSAVESGKRVSVLAGETRPFLQGARLTAWELTQDGIPTTLIADVAAGHLMARDEIDLVLVGADRVAANGDTANKIGTYSLAVLARRHGIPFYVACPVSTIDRSIEAGAAIPIEERAAAEVLGFGDCRWASPDVAVRNPAFDVTPADLITALITERGVLVPPVRDTVRALLDEKR